MDLEKVAAVVVHHRSVGTIGATVSSLVSEGFNRKSIIVVDNSEDEAVTHELDRVFGGRGIRVVTTRNCGYAAAVNRGIAVLNDDLSCVPRYVLVSTHESRPKPGAVSLLVSELADDPRLAAVGPTLVTDGWAGSSQVWSEGGYLTRHLKLPRHFGHKVESKQPQTELPGTTERQWLDGAFIVYRFDAIRDNPMREDYFLYMEEVDLHLSLHLRGWKVAWVPTAEVWQSSNGIPDFYLVRNTRILQARHGSILSRAAAAPYEILRRVIAKSKRREVPISPRTIYRGWQESNSVIRSTPRSLHPRVSIVNPLGATLAHYSGALQDELCRGGIDTTVRAIHEPSAADYGRLSWLARVYWACVLARLDSPDCVLVTWPPLGYFDLFLARLFGGQRTAVVIHDPVPLVRAIGYGRLSVRAARVLRGVTVVTHSELAGNEVASVVRARPIQIRHPLSSHTAGGSVKRAECGRPLVLVFGQYKPDRDVELLRRLGQNISQSFRLQIVGRGWPDVPNWETDDRFVPESEVDALLCSAAVVLIPYTRYYQSGVAFRCVELGVPVVGGRNPSLVDLLGSDSPLLVRDVASTREWGAAIVFAIASGREWVTQRKSVLLEDSTADWVQLLEEVSN
ncbi:glycosyltransferase [Gordonia sp. DT219]|uniref:glycosyltransferase n=1 Tax=Gordonia sp. DT219 TaxID=3416658 RepID=UPI003CE8C930